MSILIASPSVHTTANANYGSPVRMALAVVILTFGVVGGWAAVAPLASAAIAQGRIEVASKSKTIQHLEGGIIKEILVHEAEAVKAGQVLFRLAPVQAHANMETLQKQLDAALAQEARLFAELNGAPRPIFAPELMARRDVLETANAIANEERQFLERGQEFKSQAKILETRGEQSAEDIKGRQRQEAALIGQIDSMALEIGKVTPLAEKGYYPTNKLLELQRDKLRLDGELGQLRAEMAQKRQQRDETRLQIEQLTEKFRADAAHDLADARARLADVREKLSVASDVMSRIDIRAPAAGVIQHIRVSGAGAVVRAGDAIADLVPIGEDLVVIAEVSPLDIESVSTGQQAQVRFASFPSRLVPTMFGRVASASADSIYDDVAKRSYYAVRVVVDKATLPAAVASKLAPGMPAAVTITTGERTVLDYLISPLADALAKGMREQ
jgi:HlyD family type I secretion membrane fusion protein